MGLFNRKKEPDMQCWSCKQLISHKNVKWKPREIDFKGLMGNELYDEIASNKKIEKALKKENLGMKEFEIASPNQIFSHSEYEYHGKCPQCNSLLNCFWFGNDSLYKKSGDIVLDPKPFLCNKCEETIHREFQIWYTVRVLQGEEINEYLVTLCKNCNTEQGYPFEYDLNRGIIQ